MDEATKKKELPVSVNEVMGKDGFRTAHVTEAGKGGIRLPPGMKSKENL